MIMLFGTKDLINGLSGMDLLQTAMQYHLENSVILSHLRCFCSASSTFGILFYVRSNVAYLFGDKCVPDRLHAFCT